jgi:hypothetical protein
MASAGPIAGPKMPVETYEVLSEVYLALWRQLENLSVDNKWVDIRPVSGSLLQEDIRRTIECLGPDPSSTLFSDYQKTQELLLDGRAGDNVDVAGFREYLRETGLRLAQQADAMTAAPLIPR